MNEWMEYEYDINNNDTVSSVTVITNYTLHSTHTAEVVTCFQTLPRSYAETDGNNEIP
jgi:hypothetical protein